MPTEAAASKLKCPFSMGHCAGPGWCIGSACMAWQVDKPAYPGDVAGASHAVTFYLRGTDRPAEGHCAMVPI